MKLSRRSNQKQQKTVRLKQITTVGLILIAIVGLMQIFFSPQSPTDLSEIHLLEADSIASQVEVLPEP